MSANQLTLSHKLQQFGVPGIALEENFQILLCVGETPCSESHPGHVQANVRPLAIPAYDLLQNEECFQPLLSRRGKLIQHQAITR